MAQITPSFSGTLGDIMGADEIKPGDSGSYELCRKIYVYHPLGAKIVDKPIRMAQSQKRVISIGKGPDDLLLKQFEETWTRMDITRVARMAMRIPRIYGIGSLAVKVEGQEPSEPLDLWKLRPANVAFSVFDPLNTAGSLVMWAQPNDFNFQRPGPIKVQGKAYDPSRVLTIMNEEPIYLEFTSSSFGYTGRSVFQRGLFSLKSYLETMVTNRLVARKSGLIVAKVKAPGGIVNAPMRWLMGFKRDLLKEGENGDVLTIGVDEDVSSLNLTNIGETAEKARDHILKDIAIACETHAKILADEAFVDGFSEGTEDARNIAACVDNIRDDMGPIYAFLDPIVMHCAWNEEFFDTVKKQFPEEYADKSYKDAFYEWSNSFQANWPDFLREPESEEIKVREVKFRTAAAVVEILSPYLDPENKVTVLEWLCDCISGEKLLFPAPIELDFEKLLDELEERKEQEAEAQAMGEDKAETAANEPKKPPRPFADAMNLGSLPELKGAIARLEDKRAAKGKRK